MKKYGCVFYYCCRLINYNLFFNNFSFITFWLTMVAEVFSMQERCIFEWERKRIYKKQGSHDVRERRKYKSEGWIQRNRVDTFLLVANNTSIIFIVFSFYYITVLYLQNYNKYYVILASSIFNWLVKISLNKLSVCNIDNNRDSNSLKGQANKQCILLIAFVCIAISNKSLVHSWLGEHILLSPFS